MEFYASCPAGFEAALADELKGIALARVRPLTGRVSFEGDPADAMRACLWSRLASRVLVVLGRFACEDADGLYAGTARIPWEDVIREGATIAMTVHGSARSLRSSAYAGLVMKDAVCDRLVKHRGSRPDVDARRPDAHVLATLRGGRATVALDLAGDALFRRGPREGLRSDYAALALVLAGWRDACRAEGCAAAVVAGGAGSLAEEAAGMLWNRAPSRSRRRWGFKSWCSYDPGTWSDVVAEADRAALDARGGTGAVLAAGGAVGGVPGVRGIEEDPDAVAEALSSLGAERVSIAVDALDAGPGRELALTEFAARVRAACSGHGARLALVAAGDAVTVPGRPEAELSARLAGRDARIAAFAPAGGGERVDPAATVELPDGERVPILVEGSVQFANRLKKVARLRRRWAAREGVTCYRVYDADLPDYAASIDLYAGCPETPGRWLVVSEYAAPRSIDPALARSRLLDILAIAPHVLGVDPGDMRVRARTRSRGGSQYARGGARREEATKGSAVAHPIIEEGGLRFELNLDDYLDTGIFLDHRVTRGMVRSLARGRRFLNLFAYTGTATCYAADGGAESTCTVDLSNTYLAWARRNMERNGFTGPGHAFVRADVLSWLHEAAGRGERWDLVFCDPPTFSNSTRMGERTFDVQRDHVELLRSVAAVLAPGGEAVFSCNLRSFKPDVEALTRAGIALEDVSERTIPEDFQRNQRIHRCFIVTRAR